MQCNALMHCEFKTYVRTDLCTAKVIKWINLDSDIKLKIILCLIHKIFDVLSSIHKIRDENLKLHPQ